MSAKGNPKFSCPTILSHSNSKSLETCTKTDSRGKLFDSSLKTINVSVNTKIPVDLSYGPRKRVKDYLHFHEEMDYDDTYSIMNVDGVDDLMYSTLFNDEVIDNGERHAGLNSCDTGLETCVDLKPTRHGNELLDKSIQSATERGDSGIDNIIYLSGDDTGGNGHNQVYESSNNMLDSKSISENQSESDMDLVEDISSDDEIYSDTDDGEYFLVVESLEDTLDFGPFTGVPCTVASSQIQCSLTDLDPSADFKSSEVPDPSDKWEDYDFDYCVFDEMPMEIYDQNAVHSNPVGFLSSSVDIVDYVEDILRRHSSLEHLLFAKSPDDTVSFCSILTDKLQYCQSDTPDSVRYFFNDSFKAMNAKQRFFDAAFNNEPCIDSKCINSCNSNSAPKHQLTDAINSNIQNKNVLNIAEATAISNIPSKVSRTMFFPTIFLQYEKDKYESLSYDSYRKVPATNTYGIAAISGKGNV